MKTTLALKLAGGSLTQLGAVFDPPISKQAIFQWGENVPPLREYQLRELRPDWFRPAPAKKTRGKRR